MLAVPLGKDGLSGVFVAILGVPWVQLLGRLVNAVVAPSFQGAAVGLATGVVGMSINAVLIHVVSTWVTERLSTGRSE